ncbi:hypothetical protein PTKU64_57720 [Paraburkholderia terrae]|uniref:Uncharacterized protein n=1 Tax=Paraburkholderia terrae TaxID=311230 RepID=A0ABM7TTI8_9BURK|nr:hypothetical protein PTKU64_57720 [Paraburkholderia terrae]
MFVANASNVRLTHFEHPFKRWRQRMVSAAQVANYVSAFAPYTYHSGPKSTLGGSGKSTNLCGATTYTQFATWAAVEYLARRAITRVREAGEAPVRSVGNAGKQIRCRVKRKTGWGPSGTKKCWRC